MDELIAKCHQTLEEVERAPLTSIAKAISVQRSVLAMLTELESRNRYLTDQLSKISLLLTEGGGNG